MKHGYPRTIVRLYDGVSIIRPCERILSAILLACICGPAIVSAQMPGRAPAVDNSAESLEQETQRRLLEQPAGSQTLGSHDLPAEFVRRVSDRIIRMQVQQQLRSVRRPQSATADSPRPLAEGEADDRGQAASSHWGVVLICVVVVAIVAISHRKGEQPTPPQRKRRRK